MTNQNSISARNFDALVLFTLSMTFLSALVIYFVFYMPVIAQGVEAEVLPGNGIFWLETHIAAYWISYSLYLMGFLLAVVNLLTKTATRLPLIEIATFIATFLAVIGLITGILYSKPAWNTWWVWDAKHTVVLLNTMFVVGISPFVVLIRKISNPMYRNGALVVLLLLVVASCLWSFLVGFFFQIIHPQWFPRIFFDNG